MSERPRSYTFEPPVGTARTNIVNDPHRVAIHDARPHAGDYALDQHGFHAGLEQMRPGQTVDDVAQALMRVVRGTDA
jgi:hypothetical protein